MVFPHVVFLNVNYIKVEQFACTKEKNGEKEAVWQSQLCSFSIIHRALFEPVAIFWHQEYQKHIQWMRGRITIPSIRLAIDHLLQRVMIQPVGNHGENTLMMSVRLYFFLGMGWVGWEWLKYKTDSCPPILLESWTHSVHFKASSPQTNQKKKGTVFNIQLNKIKFKLHPLIFP